MIGALGWVAAAEAQINHLRIQNRTPGQTQTDFSYTGPAFGCIIPCANNAYTASVAATVTRVQLQVGTPQPPQHAHALWVQMRRGTTGSWATGTEREFDLDSGPNTIQVASRRTDGDGGAITQTHTLTINRGTASPRIILSGYTFAPTEGGSHEAYTVRLAVQPTGPVRVSVSRNNAAVAVLPK